MTEADAILALCSMLGGEAEVSHKYTIDEGSYSVRVDCDTVAEYAEVMSINVNNLPAVVVFYDGTDHWLADGFHRLEALERIGHTSDFPVHIFKGDRRSAILRRTCPILLAADFSRLKWMRLRSAKMKLLHRTDGVPFQSEQMGSLPMRTPSVTIRSACLTLATPPRKVPTEEPPPSPVEMPLDAPELPEPPSPEVPGTPPDEAPETAPSEMPPEEGCG